MQATLRQLEYFVAVADTGQVSAAAARCHVSQPAMSSSLTELETKLGIQLLIRHRAKGVHLTQDGQRLLGHARALIAQAEELEQAAQEFSSGVSGSVRFGCHALLSTLLLPGLLEGLTDEAPEIELDVREAPAPELQSALHRGEIELAALFDVELDPDLTAHRVVTLMPRVLLPADHPLAGRPEVALSDLRTERLIMLDVPPSAEHTAKVLDAAGLVPVECFRTASYETMRCLVGRGLGFAVVLQAPATAISNEGRPLVVRPITHPKTPVNVVLARARGLRPTRRSREVERICIEGLTAAG